MSQIVAILVSDVHLSQTAPVARSAESDWFAAMQRPLDEISDQARAHDAPVVIAGDIFDRWRSGPEVINFALEHLPQAYAIPGQHDLPNHSLEEIKRSAYWTLVEAKKIVHLTETTLLSGGVSLHPFPWGSTVTPLENGHPDALHLAVVHSYIWKDGFGYQGADVEKKVNKYRDSLKGYDAAVFGDNHQGFTTDWKTEHGRLHLINCGTLMRRKVDEYDYRPMVGLLYNDGTIAPHCLDTSQDKFLEESLIKAKETELLNMTDFVDQLKSLGADSLDFRAAINRYMNDEKIEPEVREVVLEAIG